MSNRTRTHSKRMIATTGNQTLYPAGQAVLADNNTPLPKVGQPVLWDPHRNLSLQVSDLATVNIFELGVVVRNSKGNKVLVAVDGSDWNLCQDNFTVTHTLPECACPQKMDMYFRCVKPWTGYSISVRYRDAYTQALYGGDGDVSWQFNYAKGHDSWNCDGCENPSISAWEVACGLAHEVNTYNEVKSMEQVGLVNTGDQVYMPIKAAALPYGKSFHKLCLTPGSTSCSSCSTLTGLRTLRLTTTPSEGAPVIQNIDLTMFNEAGETDTELMLKDIYHYLEAEMAKINGFIYIGGGTGKCCDYEIEIGGCFDSAILIVGEEGDETNLPFVATNPWDQNQEATVRFTKTANCQPCTSESTPYFPEAMIRLYTESILAPCGCFDLPADNLNFKNHYKQIVEVNALEGFNQDLFTTVVSQEQKYPSNFGYYFLLNLDDQSSGGRGQGWFQGGKFYGRFPQKMYNHKMFDSQYNIKCNIPYCSINMMIRKGEDPNILQNSIHHTVTSEVLLLIPTTDVATYDSLRDMYNYLASLGRCNKLIGGCFTLPTAVVIDQGADESIAEDATVQLTLTWTPVGSVTTGTWSTANAAVATVSQTGLVTGVAAGTTNITFTPSYGTAAPVVIAITVT